MAKSTRRLWNRRKGTRQLYENFSVGGTRFRRGLGTTDQAEAQRKAAENKALAEQDVRLSNLRARGLIPDVSAQREMTLAEALVTYHDEHGRHLPSAANMVVYARRLRTLGAETLLSKLTKLDLQDFCRRLTMEGLGPRSINAHLNHLRSVIRRVAGPVNTPAIKWGELKQREPKVRRPIVESDAQAASLMELMDEDLKPLFRFSLVTGVRQMNCLTLTWEQVHWNADIPYIRFMQKSKIPGGEPHDIPLTRGLLEILAPLRGHHPTHVFTYLCKRSRHEVMEDGSRMLRRKGERYPWSRYWLRDCWQEVRKKSGMTALNWHRLRASAATRLLLRTGDPGRVMALTGHRDLKTLLGYTAGTAALPSVAAMMEQHAITPESKGEAKRPLLEVIKPTEGGRDAV